MSSHEPFPEQHNQYPWHETVNETALRRELSDAVNGFGDAYTFSQNTNVQIALDDGAGETTTQAFGGYERHGHMTYVERVDDIGLTLSLSERHRYEEHPDGTFDPVEPIRMGVSMSESPLELGMAAEIIVPSRHMADTFTDYSRIPDEVLPPRVRIQLAPGVTVKGLAEKARMSLSLAPENPKRNPSFPYEEIAGAIIDRTEELFVALDVENLPPDDNGVRKGEISLTPEMMDKTREWVETYFSGHTFVVPPPQ